MKISSDCIPCAFRQLKSLLDRATTSPRRRSDIYNEFVDVLYSGATLPYSPPDYVRVMSQVLFRHCGTLDMYRREKDASTALACALRGTLQEELSRQPDWFAAMVKFVIGGNILDYGIFDDLNLDTARKLMLDVFDLPLDEAKINAFRVALDKANSIFYILDNCGEAVFDAMFLERYRGKVAIGVRGGPALNDVTRRELEASGLTGFPVYDTGDFTPGVNLSTTSVEFLEKMRTSDLVVAKGQGNLESMDDYDRPVFFLFRAKCPVVCNYLGGLPLNSLQILPRNL